MSFSDPSLQIVKATPGELELLAPQIDQIYVDNIYGGDPDSASPYTLLDPEYEVYVATREGAIIGAATLHLAAEANDNRQVGEITDVAVIEGERDKGIGSLLISAAIGGARVAGKPAVQIYARSVDAGRLYRRLDFTPSGENKEAQVGTFIQEIQ